MTREWIIASAVAIVAAVAALLAVRLLANLVRKSARTIELRDARGLRARFTLSEDESFEDAVLAQLPKIDLKRPANKPHAAL